MIHIKYCRKCKGAFDIDTEKDLCPDCRNSTELKGGQIND